MFLNVSKCFKEIYERKKSKKIFALSRTLPFLRLSKCLRSVRSSFTTNPGNLIFTDGHLIRTDILYGRTDGHFIRTARTARTDIIEMNGKTTHKKKHYIRILFYL